MKRDHIFIAISVVILGTFFLYSYQVYPQLPAKIPVHFDLYGRPDRWSERTMLGWMTLPIIATIMAIFFQGLGMLIPVIGRHSPGWINVPQRDKFLSLPPEKQFLVLSKTTELLHVFTIEMLVVLLWVQWSTAQVALGVWKTIKYQLPMLIVFVVLLVVSIVYYTIKIRQTIIQLHQEHNAFSPKQSG